MKKLYELNGGEKIRIPANSKVPPAHREIGEGEVLKFVHVDGMYSLCYDSKGNPVHPVAWAEVEIVK